MTEHHLTVGAATRRSGRWWARWALVTVVLMVAGAFMWQSIAVWTS